MAAMPTIPLNKETLGLVIACFTVAGSIFGVYNWLLSGRAENSPVVRELVIKNVEQDNRLDNFVQSLSSYADVTKEQTQEMKNLNASVTRLTTVMEQNGLMTKKAEYTFPSPARQAATYEVR